MPSSLIIVALVVAWLVVLVPMVARKRQESARSVGEEYDAMPDAEYDDIHDIDDDYFDEEEYVERPFRRGRGGYDPETAALVAQAKYAFRRRVVAFLLVAAVVTGIVAGVFYTPLWYGPRGRSTCCSSATSPTCAARCGSRRRSAHAGSPGCSRCAAAGPPARSRSRTLRLPSRPRSARSSAPIAETTEVELVAEPIVPALPPMPRFEHHVRPGTIPVDSDDEDPVFVELDGLESLRYRGAVGA